MGFTKIAQTLQFKPLLASDMHAIGVAMTRITRGRRRFRCKQDVISFLKLLGECAIDDGEYYVKYWYEVKAFLISYKSNLRTFNSMYHCLIYHHPSMKGKNKFPEYLCRMYEISLDK